MARAKSAENAEPPAPTDPFNTVHEIGGQRRIVFARIANGSEPAKQFYDSLSDHDKNCFDALFIWICEHGSIKNDTKFHPKVGEITCVRNGTTKGAIVAEFKSHSGPGYRIFAVLEGDAYVLTHGCKKPKAKQFGAEISKAQRYYCEDRGRRFAAMVRKGQ